jgi:hypothetical protein
MAKKRKTPAQPGQDWNAPAAELLAELPTDRDELLAAAVAAGGDRRGNHARRWCGRRGGQRSIRGRHPKMNGGTHVGSMADHDAPGGHRAPLRGGAWRGLVGPARPVLVADGDMRASGGVRGRLRRAAGCRSVPRIDTDRPFISETGYRSHFDTARGCMTVDEVARGIRRSGAEEAPGDGRGQLPRPPADAPRPWLAGLEPARREPATVLVPPGFVLVDVVLPSHRAFIADAGQPRRRQDQGGQGRRVERWWERAQAPSRSRIARNDDDLHRSRRRCRADRGRACIAGNDDAK